MKDLCRRIVEAHWFENAIITLIVINAVVLGLETSQSLTERFGFLMKAVNYLVLAVFILEAIMKITAVAPEFRKYFGNGWNMFDFSIVCLSLIPATGQFAMVARMARLLRVLRLLSAMPELRLIVSTLLRSLPGLGHVIMLLAVIFYMYGVAGFYLFHEHDPTHWQSLGVSLLTLFRVLTLEDWTDVMYTAMEMNAYSWIFFVSFVVTATFIVINLFIAVVINNLEEAKKERSWIEVSDVSHSVVLNHLQEVNNTLLRLERHIQSAAVAAGGPAAGNSRPDPSTVMQAGTGSSSKEKGT